MLRILEPELMDTPADAEEYDAMDFAEADTLFAVDALALIAHRPDAQVLDIGTGTAKIPILMLDRRKDLHVLGVDMAQEMLKVAHRNLLRAGYDEACKLGRLDAKSLRLPAARYDLVMCNSTVHHIPDPRTTVLEIARTVRPDGAILVRDLVRPPSMDDAWAIVKRVAAGDGKHQQKLFFDSLCAALTLSEAQELFAKAGLADVEVRMCSDRHWSAERRAR